MANVVDRRTEADGRFVSSRERFMRRNIKQIKEAIERNISDKTLEDIGKGGVDVTVPGGGIHEPFIHHGKGGVTERVLPGNKDFSVGDRVKRPPGGGGGKGGPDPSDGPDGNDDFIFTLSEEEFLNILYADLALPNMTKQSAQDTEQMKPKREGFTTDGPINKLDLPRSKTAQMARHIALNKPHDRKILELMKAQRGILLAYDPAHSPGAEIERDLAFEKEPLYRRLEVVGAEVAALREKFAPVLTPEDRENIERLDRDITARERKKSLVPKWNENDLRFRNHEMKPTPTTQAVMFCLMDVSGSMGDHEKNNAKLFYMLLYRFLKRNYDKVDVVFIRHTTTAEEVDEKTFFYDPLSGGTTVSTVLAKMRDVIAERYPVQDWNIYGAQASDGDNFDSDNPECDRLLRGLLRDVQAYFYTEVQHPYGSQGKTSLWKAYEPIMTQNPGRFFMGSIKDRPDIWPVFREFFQKRESYDKVPSSFSASAFQPAMP